MKALVGFWEGLRDCNAPRKQFAGFAEAATASSVKSGAKGFDRELFKPYRAPEPQIAPPPSYNEASADLPPDYTGTDALAGVHFTSLPLGGSVERKEKQKSDTVLLGQDAEVDLSAIEGVRSHANKKAKKAAKAAQQAKWADSDNEENKEGGENAGEDGNGGGDAGGGAGGDGGDPPGGGDGGDDDWFTGTSKKDVSDLWWLGLRAAGELEAQPCMRARDRRRTWSGEAADWFYRKRRRKRTHG